MTIEMDVALGRRGIFLRALRVAELADELPNCQQPDNPAMDLQVIAISVVLLS